MGLALLILVVAVVAGLLAGGRLAGLIQLPIKDGGWLVAALLIQLVGSLTANVVGFAYPLGLVISVILAARFVFRNLELTGIPLAGLGLLANTLVVCLNGAMPVAADAAARAGVSFSGMVDSPRHEAANADTILRFLADIVPVPFPFHREVISLGDILVAAGIGIFVFAGMLSRVGDDSAWWVKPEAAEPVEPAEPVETANEDDTIEIEAIKEGSKPRE